MTSSTAFLALAIVGLALSLATWFRVRVAGWLLVPTFVVGWLRGELALQTIAVEMLVTMLFVLEGIHRGTAGQVGLGLTLLSWTLLVSSHLRGVGAGRVLAAALAPLGIKPTDDVSAFHGFFRPFAFGHPEVRCIRNLEYGPSLPGDKGGRNRLDLYLPIASKPGDRRPVLLQIHGGAWIIGDKRDQGRPLMTQLAARGWVCAASNYRLSPAATMPDQIVDVKRAIAWLRSQIADYGGDPDFICITGGSAGGHLSSLAALTPSEPRFQLGFESVDTRVEACVPFYGVFDFLDRAGDRRFGKMSDALGPMIFKCKPEKNFELWDSVCPVSRIDAGAPPFFVIQGTHDSLVFSEEAVRFVGLLRKRSENVVVHAELPGAQHAFEIFHSPRSAHAVHAATAFLEWVHDSKHGAGRG